VFWPVRSWYWPALHAVQLLLPAALWYSPDWHDTHVWHSLLPEVNFSPARQVLALQLDLPDSIWYSPVAQAMHSVRELPAAAYLPASQSLQTAAALNAVGLDTYFPAAAHVLVVHESVW
jgi:hypothetical protein